MKWGNTYFRYMMNLKNRRYVMKTLIVVDMQNDFITGSLGSKEAEKIVPYVKDLYKRHSR